jgi:uncharacterized coiled-coil protein SlyX
MPTLEERVAFLEGQMSELSHGLIDLRDAVRQLHHQMDARFVQVDARFAQVDARFDLVDRRLGSLEDKISSQFMWVVGVQVTTLVAIVGALLAKS